MKVAAAKIWKVVVGIGVVVGLLTGVPTVLDMYGVYLGPAFGWLAYNSGWLLPIAAFLIGLACGWLVRNQSTEDNGEKNAAIKEQTEKIKEQAQRIEELEAENEQLGGYCAYYSSLADDLTEALEGKPPEKDPNPYGFSKRALNAWNLMEEADMKALGCLGGASVLNGGTFAYPLVMDMDGTLESIGLDVQKVKSLERLGLVERYPQEALIPIPEGSEKQRLAQGVNAVGGDAVFSTPEGIYMTRGCTAQFCTPGDFASPKMQCVYLGLYGYTDIGREILCHVGAAPQPGLCGYLDAAYQKRRGAEHPFHRWAAEV